MIKKVILNKKKLKKMIDLVLQGEMNLYDGDDKETFEEIALENENMFKDLMRAWENTDDIIEQPIQQAPVFLRPPNPTPKVTITTMTIEGGVPSNHPMDFKPIRKSKPKTVNSKEHVSMKHVVKELEEFMKEGLKLAEKFSFDDSELGIKNEDELINLENDSINRTNEKFEIDGKEMILITK